MNRFVLPIAALVALSAWGCKEKNGKIVDCTWGGTVCVDKKDLSKYAWLKDAACVLQCNWDGPGLCPWEDTGAIGDPHGACEVVEDYLDAAEDQNVMPDAQWECRTPVYFYSGEDGVSGEWFPMFWLNDFVEAVNICADTPEEAALNCEWQCQYYLDTILEMGFDLLWNVDTGDWVTPEDACGFTQPSLTNDSCDTLDDQWKMAGTGVISPSSQVLTATAAYAVSPITPKGGAIAMEELTLEAQQLTVPVNGVPVELADIAISLVRPAVARISPSGELAFGGPLTLHVTGSMDGGPREGLTELTVHDVTGAFINGVFTASVAGIPDAPGMGFTLQMTTTTAP